MAPYQMSSGDATALLGALAESGVDVCVGGGWGVDALLGEQTREHSDLDLWLAATDFEGLVKVFVDHGVDRIFPWPGDRPWNFVLHDGLVRRVDLHVYEVLAGGSIQYGSVLDPFLLPAAALRHPAAIAGVPVRAEQPRWAVKFHTGYPPRPSDFADVRRLCDHYSLELPAGYR